MDVTLTGTTTMGENGLESNSNEGVLHIPHTPRLGPRHHMWFNVIPRTQNKEKLQRRQKRKMRCCMESHGKWKKVEKYKKEEIQEKDERKKENFFTEVERKKKIEIFVFCLLFL